MSPLHRNERRYTAGDAPAGLSAIQVMGRCSAGKGAMIVERRSAPVRSDGSDFADRRWLGELDRAGWAWEWLRRHPDYGGGRAGVGESAGVPIERKEDALFGWGLHFR